MMTFAVGLVCDNCGKTYAKEFHSMKELEATINFDDTNSWIAQEDKHFCSKQCKNNFKSKETKNPENKV